MNKYRDNVIVSALSRQISWTNNIVILSSTKTIEEKEFYSRLCIKHNYSYRELNSPQRHEKHNRKEKK